MRAFLAGARLQLVFFRVYPDVLIPFFTAPLYAVIFQMIFRHAGRQDLSGYAAIAPVFIALWWMALFISGWTITTERWNGTLEMLVAAPSSFVAGIFGRIMTTTLAGIVSFAEMWVVARLFGTRIPVEHAWQFVAIVMVTLASMAGTATAMASLYVLARHAATFGNSASFPFYVLGGILVPVSLLPHWVRPLSSVVFLSWSADLLRAALRPEPIHQFAFRIGMLALLGLCGLAVGVWTMHLILRRVRQKGELGTT